MIRRWFVPTACVVLAACSSTEITAADFGLATKHFANIEMYRPPVVPLRGRTLTVTNQNGAPFANIAAIQVAISQALSDFASPSAGTTPDLALTFSVVNAQPASPKRPVQTERRMVTSGNTTQEQNVSVQYWEAQALLGIQVDIRDTSGTVVENRFKFEAKYFKKYQLAINGVASVRDVTQSSGQNCAIIVLCAPANASGSTRFDEPTAQSIENDMIANLARQVQTRYTKSKLMAQVRLAVPEALRPGNQLAMAGQWETAVASWKNAKIDPKKDKGEQDYNMATGHAALFYAKYNESGDPADFDPHYQEAMRLYESARRKDPGESEYRGAMNGVKLTTEDFNRAKDQWALGQRELQRLEEVAKNRAAEAAEAEKAKKALETDSDPNRPDTADEAAFRRKVRLSLRDINDDPGPSAEQAFVRDGQELYKLRAGQAERVIKSELAFRRNAAAYKQEYGRLFRTGNRIDADEREVLSDLAKRLNLDAADTAVIEAQSQPPASVVSPTAAAPVRTDPPKPAAPKPAQAAKPTPPKPTIPAATDTKKSGTPAQPPTVIKK